ncbi:MAG: cysteine--tRNA ligase [Candidatus Paceibacterota bacterium]|jgi:cysteinyl-tRNA synthetase
MIKLYNTLTRQKEEFKPIKPGEAGIYTCGPTVYWFAHIGNLRAFIFEELLKRTLKYNGYKVKHVMNLTDVGHLTSDEDTGEDKLEKGARRDNKSVWEVAEFYTQAFKKDLSLLNFQEPDVWIKATDTIKEQLELIKVMEEKGFTYVISDGVYFDTSKLPAYGKLWPNKKMELKAGARVELAEGKKNHTDFALWKFSPKEGPKRQMEWDSPWGIGFPGWHTECVVMSIENLGIPFDIHCGGIDHILIHHTNEIAQAEAAYGRDMCNYWVHGEFLVLKNDEKMAKSAGTVVLVEDLIKKGFNPLAYRYLLLTAHYRKKMEFSWEALESAQTGLNNLYEKFLEFKENKRIGVPFGKKSEEHKSKFLEAINDDLNMPQALAVAWDIVKDKDLASSEKYYLLLDFDKIFGLNLDKAQRKTEEDVPEEIKKLLEERQAARQAKDWTKSDEVRKQIQALGWEVEDTAEGQKAKKL